MLLCAGGRAVAVAVPVAVAVAAAIGAVAEDGERSAGGFPGELLRPTGVVDAALRAEALLMVCPGFC